MKKIKLTTSIFIMLMISTTLVFAQTAQKSTSDQKQATAKTTTVQTDQQKSDQSNSTSTSTSAKCSHGSAAQGANFVDSNNDGLCDHCGNKKENCKESNCKAKQSSTSDGKSSGCCSGAKKKSCSHSCGGH